MSDSTTLTEVTAPDNISITLGLGLGLLILLMLLIGVLSMVEMKGIHEQLDAVESERSVKNRLSQQMIDAVRDRRLLTIHIIHAEDPFLRNEYGEQFHQLASHYLSTREQLIATGLTPREQQAIDQSLFHSGNASKIMNSIVDQFLQPEEVSTTTRLRNLEKFRDELTPILDDAERSMREIHQLTLVESQRKRAQARQTYQTQWQLLLALAAIAITLGIAITIYVFRKVSVYDREMRLLHQQLNEIACHDELTGLSNRRNLLNRLSDEILQARRYHHRFALLYLDLDGFKPVNDHHGHDSGDALLVRVGTLFSGQIRGGDLLARIGGDEFAVIVNQIDSSEDALRASRRLLQALTDTIPLPNGTSVQLGVSIGIALYPEHGINGSELLDRADSAMYEAKRTGKNRCCLWSPKIQSDEED